MKASQRMMSRAALLLAACLAAATAAAQVNVRVSVKFILGASGQRPSTPGSTSLTSDTEVSDNIALANDLMDRGGRGYRFLLTEIQDVSGASGFFDIPARNKDNANALEAVATSNATTRAQFSWRNNAINVYINNTSSGVCSFPGGGNVIFIGSGAYDTLILHEVGHFLTSATPTPATRTETWTTGGMAMDYPGRSTTTPTPRPPKSMPATRARPRRRGTI